MDLSFLDAYGGPKVVAAAVVGLVALVLLYKILSRPKEDQHHVTKRCESCGWTGSVSKYHAKCPRCAKQLV